MTEPVGILGEIAAAKRAELATRYDGVSLDSLRSRALPTQRSLAEALAKPGARFILEIKKASPSEGSIRAGAEPAILARGYAGVADALSVRGIPVIEVLSETSCRPHQLTAFAHVEGTNVTYPPEQGLLL